MRVKRGVQHLPCKRTQTPMMLDQPCPHNPTAAKISSYTFPIQPSMRPPLATTPRPPTAQRAAKATDAPWRATHLLLLCFLALFSAGAVLVPQMYFVVGDRPNHLA